MYLLQFIQTLTDEDNDDKLNYGLEGIQSRLDWLEEREPESCGNVYDVWQDKFDELQNIYDELEEYINQKEESEYDLIDIITDLEFYQDTFGGLSRFKI